MDMQLNSPQNIVKAIGIIFLFFIGFAILVVVFPKSCDSFNDVGYRVENQSCSCKGLKFTYGNYPNSSGPTMDGSNSVCFGLPGKLLYWHEDKF